MDSSLVAVFGLQESLTWKLNQRKFFFDTNFRGEIQKIFIHSKLLLILFPCVDQGNHTSTARFLLVNGLTGVFYYCSIDYMGMH
jgi:hypothetical protein